MIIQLTDKADFKYNTHFNTAPINISEELLNNLVGATSSRRKVKKAHKQEAAFLRRIYGCFMS